MKLLHLLPVTGSTLVPPEEEIYLQRLLPPDVQVDFDQITEGVDSIECEYDEAMCAPDVIRHVVAAEAAGYDGVFVSCFGDPGVRPAREAVKIPVFGGFEPTMLAAMGMGDKIGILSIVPECIPLVRNGVSRLHWDARVACIRHIGIPVLELHADHQRMVDAVVEQSIKAIEEDGADVIVLGCTGMCGVTKAAQARLLERGYDVPVVEPATCSLNMLELFVRLGYRHNKMTYMPLRQK